MVVSRDQNAGRGHNINNDNKSFEMTEQLKYVNTPKKIKILCSKKVRAD